MLYKQLYRLTTNYPGKLLFLSSMLKLLRQVHHLSYWEELLIVFCAQNTKEKCVLVSHYTSTLNILETYCKLRSYSYYRLDGWLFLFPTSSFGTDEL